MQEALGRGDCGTVLRLLPSASAAAGWSPTDRAALYDLALQAAADSGDADEARRLVGRMWRRGVPVGSVAHTAMLRALCGVGRHADALEYLRRVPAKRQRTAMYSTLLRECNRQGAWPMGWWWRVCSGRQLGPALSFQHDGWRACPLGARGDWPVAASSCLLHCHWWLRLLLLLLLLRTVPLPSSLCA
jgi:hypothetical protein